MQTTMTQLTAMQTAMLQTMPQTMMLADVGTDNNNAMQMTDTMQMQCNTEDGQQCRQ
jgi:hypothetical protein